jgi:hypothetical protein
MPILTGLDLCYTWFTLVLTGSPRPPSPSFFFWFRLPIASVHCTKRCWRYFWLPINLRHQDYVFRLPAPNRAKLLRNQHHIMSLPPLFV